jgi:triphosphoribosyl-dephospho-CoA synthase
MSAAVKLDKLTAPFPIATFCALQIGRAAIVSLYDELALYPKPGLVSFVDTGSHSDMNGATFMRSLFSLRHYFADAAELGFQMAPFSKLENLGIAAEWRMLHATGGINTHRGAIFTLGLLCASAGRLHATGKPLSPSALRSGLVEGWGEALSHRRLVERQSNGQRAARAYGMRSVGDEAALGFPVLFEHAVPAFRAATAVGMDKTRVRLQTFFHIMAHLDDTNLAIRGGFAGLTFAKHTAAEFLSAGGVERSDAMDRARSIHAAFVERRLSPGGAADMLACACWIQRICGDECVSVCFSLDRGHNTKTCFRGF